MNEDFCKKCGHVFEEDEGRFNFVNGAMCRLCGHPATLLIKEAEDALKKYEEITGYKPRIRY